MHAQLELSPKDHANKGLVVCNSFDVSDLEPIIINISYQPPHSC